MLNRLTQFLLLSLAPVAVLAQQPETPIWEMRFYIEDAVGNKDTLEVIAAENASASELDPAWNEEIAPLPLNATFGAVIVAERFDIFPEPTYQKRTVIKANYIPPIDCHSFSSTIGIYIHAIHQPVTIKWDRALFNSERCLRSSLISNNYGHDAVTLWDWFNPTMPNNVFWCMASEDSLVIETTAEAYTDVFFPITNTVEIEGMGEQTIYGVAFLGIDYPYWPCVNIVAAGEAEEAEAQLALAPNPVREEAQLAWPASHAARWLAVWGADGRLHQQYAIAQGAHTFTLPVAALPAGLYWIVLQDEQGGILRRSFVKQ